MIALRAKGIDFDVTYINLREKPDWFLKVSPHGKVPVLVVDEQPLFESNAIAEFLDEMVPPRLHPEDPAATDNAMPAEESADIVAICRLLEGMPLGIELAAAWTRALPLAEIRRDQPAAAVCR